MALTTIYFSNLWSNMGSTYDYMDSTEQALEYYNKAGKPVSNSSAIQPVMQTISLTLASFISYPITTRRHCCTCKKLQALFTKTGNKTTISAVL